MKAAPASTTVESLYPNLQRTVNRAEWYLNVEVLRPKKQFSWTLTERILLYKLRVTENKSIAEIQRYFRKKNKIPIVLGEEDTNDKFSRTRLHNQIRLVRGAFKGLCYKCRSPLTKKDLKRINRRDKEDPSLGLCTSCSEEVSEYKKIRRDTALKLGICPACVTHKVIKGHTLCKGCISASHRHRYIKGLCGRCGEKPLAKNSVSLCDDCLKENSVSSKMYRRRVRLEKKKVVK